MLQFSFSPIFVLPNIRQDIKALLPYLDTLSPKNKGKLVGLGLNCKILRQSGKRSRYLPLFMGNSLAMILPLFSTTLYLAERRAGEMLREMEREKPGEYQKLHDETFDPKPNLEDLGISKIQSHRWQLYNEGKELEAIESEKARGNLRLSQGRGIKKGVENFPQVKTRDKVAETNGLGRAGEMLREQGREPGETDKKIMLDGQTLSPTLHICGYIIFEVIPKWRTFYATSIAKGSTNYGTF